MAEIKLFLLNHDNYRDISLDSEQYNWVKKHIEECYSYVTRIRDIVEDLWLLST